MSLSRIHFTILSLVALTLGGCGDLPNRGGPSVAPASVQMQAVTKEVTATKGIVEEMITAAHNATPENLESSRATIEALGKSALQHLDSATTQSASSERAARSDESQIDTLKKQIAAMQEKDPVKSWLTLIGIAALVIGGAAIIGSFLVPALANFAWIRSTAVAVVLLGVCLLTMAHFLTWIYWIAGISLLVITGFWLWTHRAIVKEDAKWILKPNPSTP